LTGALCRRQGFYEQAEFIESCASKSIADPDAINRALAVLRQICIYDDINHGQTRRAQQPVAQEFGRLRRSSSFQKLRQSIRRGSEKLVQKLRGTPTTAGNSQLFDSAQYSAQLSSSQSHHHNYNNHHHHQYQQQQPYHHHHHHPNYQQQQNYQCTSMKRASSMSMLNHEPLQHQQRNRPLTATHSAEQQHQTYASATARRRLGSTENLHGH
jgi:hypothetical protein